MGTFNPSYTLLANPAQGGINLDWTFPFGYPNGTSNIRLYIQRSTTANLNDWPLNPNYVREMNSTYDQGQPYYHDPNSPPPAPAETGWTTIQQFDVLAAPGTINTLDPFTPTVTTYYRMIMFVFEGGPGHWFEYDYAPSSVGPTKTAFPGSIVLAKNWGGPANDSIDAVAVAANGVDIVVVGHFKGTIDLDPLHAGSGSILTASPGYVSMYIARYTASGGFLWGVKFGVAGDIAPHSMVLDSSDKIYVAGHVSQGTGNLGGSDWAVVGQSDSFVAGYSSVGVYSWDKHFGAANGSAVPTTYNNIFWSLAIDAAGALIAAGQMQGLVDFGAGNLDTVFHTAPAGVIYKCARASGTITFAKTFTAGNNYAFNGICVDANSNIYGTGFFFTSVNFASNDSADKTITTGSPTYQNTFVVKFSSSGVCQWAFRRGGVRGDKGQAVFCDNNMNVVVVGMFYKSTDLGNGTITGGAVDLDGFIAKYSGLDGSYRWAQTMLGNNALYQVAVRCDSQNNVVCTGYYYGTFAFSGASGGSSITTTSVQNSYDGWTAKYDQNGNLLWVTSYGGNKTDGGQSIAFNNSRNVIIGGSFANNVDTLGSGAQTGVQFGSFLLTADTSGLAGASDGLLLELKS